MEIEIMEVAGFEPAIQAMRLPMKSWDKADSDWDFTYGDNFTIGTKDHELSMKLIKSGSDHRKHIRLIDVWMRVKAPRAWWSEFDTYRMGADKVSESTMHRILKDEVTSDDFCSDYTDHVTVMCFLDLLHAIKKNDEFTEVEKLNIVKMNLPEGYLQTRIVKCSYEALHNMYKARKNHKLREWREFCQEIEKLPYSEFITMEEVTEND